MADDEVRQTGLLLGQLQRAVAEIPQVQGGPAVATPTQTPSRDAMLEVANYLDALDPKSGLLGRIALRAVSKILRERAPKA